MLEPVKPVVFSVATPIGNLEDLSARAGEVLKLVDIIAAEDTRNALKLLNHLGIRGKQLVSYQDHGEAERATRLIERIVNEQASLALITDAGTPCIADPGYRITQAAHAAGVPVVPIPGPSALTAIVSASGLPSDRVLFVGFLPVRSSAVEAEIASWAVTRAAIVFFTPTRRLAKNLAQIEARYPEARVAIGRELTKLYEEVALLSIAEAGAWVASHTTLKGEAVVMVHLGGVPAGSVDEEGAPVDRAALTEKARRAFKSGSSLKDLLREMRDCGLARSDLYALLLAAKDAD